MHPWSPAATVPTLVQYVLNTVPRYLVICNILQPMNEFLCEYIFILMHRYIFASKKLQNTRDGERVIIVKQEGHGQWDDDDTVSPRRKREWAATDRLL